MNFTPSATTHGIAPEDMTHAVKHALRPFDEGEGMTMFVGPARNAALLEIGVVTGKDGDPLVVHAMRARRKYLTPMGL